VKLKEIESRILPVLRRHDVAEAGLFGSAARGEVKKSSDIDILIRFRGKRSLLDLVGLKLDLEETLRRKIDVVEYPAIHPFIRERVLREQVKVL